MSDTSDQYSSEGEEEVDKQSIFVNKLKENIIVFNKSQVPQIKKEKVRALDIITQHYKEILNITLTSKQVAKKIRNMKVEVKKKFDMNKTGNKKIIFKPWEKMLMDLLEVGKKILCSIKFQVEYTYMYV